MPPSRPPEPSGDSPPRTIHDSFFKQVFGDPLVAAEELRAVLPEPVVARIDWSSLRPGAANFVGAVFQQRYSDLVYEARLVDGGEALLWIMLCPAKDDMCGDYTS